MKQISTGDASLSGNVKRNTFVMIHRMLECLGTRIESARARRLAENWCIAGEFRRIYHFHIRKTAGTSLNSAFWGLAGRDLSTIRGQQIIADDYIFVRHNQTLIERGLYFFANSHLPEYRLTLPPDTFTVTVLRDPLKRLVSYFRYLIWARDDPTAPEREPAYSGLRFEMQWLGRSFDEFLTRLPKEHLLAQLQMFSADFVVEEAAQRICQCNAVCFTESFSDDVRQLAGRLELPLQVKHERRFGNPVELSREEERRAREMLAPEFALIELVTRARNTGAK